MFTANLYFDTVPTKGTMTENGDVIFMGMLREDTNFLMYLGVNADGSVYLYDPYSAGATRLNWNLYDYLNQWIRVTIKFRRQELQLNNVTAEGGMRVYLNNALVGEIYSVYPNYISYAWVGLQCAYEAHNWVMYADKLQMDFRGYIIAYYLPGYPYSAIEQIWDDGGIIPQLAPTWAGNLPYIQRMRQQWNMKATASPFPWGEYTFYPAYGLVDITQLQSPPNGTVFGLYQHDTTQHPVDILAGLLTTAGLGALLNSTQLAAAKAVFPNDIVGCYFDSTTCGSAASDIVSRLLYDVFENKGQIIIQPYQGTPLTTSVMTLNRSNFDFEKNFDMTAVKTGVVSKWGWYDHYGTNESVEVFYRVDAWNTPTGIQGLSQGASCVVTWPNHSLCTGNPVTFSGITQSGWTALNGNNYAITVIDANTFSIPINTSSFSPYSLGPGTIACQLKAILGDQPRLLDLSYGGDVATADGATATAKANLLVKRISGAVDPVTGSGSLRLVRLQMGDGVTVHQPAFSDTDLIYEVVGKVINLKDYTVAITANRYQGEGS